TFSKKNITIEELSNEIAKNSTYRLVYQSSYASQLKPVTIHVTNATLQQLLDEYFRTQPYTYKFINQIITLIPKENLPPASKLVSIKGKILNEQNEPIPGATIAIKGTNQQTETNENGEFTLISVNEINLNIVITSINYESQEINWQGEQELDIRLKQH